jgi:hypothetical protein
MSSKKKNNVEKNHVHDVLARIAEYKHIPSLNVPQRIAHFLDWSASHIKKTYFQYNIICKAINGYNHTPRLDTKDVEMVRYSMTRVKHILREKYKRGFDYSRGLGVRATVDDNDTTNYSLANAARRFVSSKQNVDRIASIIDQSKLSAKESTYFSNVTGASKLITTTQIQKLLPPKTTSSDPK